MYVKQRLNYVCTLKIASQQISKLLHYLESSDKLKKYNVLINPLDDDNWSQCDSFYIFVPYLKDNIRIWVNSEMGHEINIKRSVFKLYHKSIGGLKYTDSIANNQIDLYQIIENDIINKIIYKFMGG
jgi:hypothetical protein